MRFESARLASKGARSYQEDSATVWTDAEHEHAPPGDAPTATADKASLLLAILADGMGGHAGGALASKTACETFTTAFAGKTAPIKERLQQGLEDSNKAIAQTVDQNPALNGMGTTLIAAAFSDAGLEWISVGDSPLYLWRRGEIALLNEDHSLAPALDQLAVEGKMTWEAARSDPRRHMLRSAITGEPLDMVDLSKKPLALEVDDYVILASDGLHTIDDAMSNRMISAYAGDGPAAIAAALLREIENARDPYQDNTTVVVVRCSSDD